MQKSSKTRLEENRNKVINNITDELSQDLLPKSENSLGIEFSDKEKIHAKDEKKTNQDSYDEVHGRLYKMTHENTIPWRNYIIYGLLLTMLTCAFTFSRYASQLTSTDSVTVAGFKYSIVGESGTDVTVTESVLSKTLNAISFGETESEAKTYTFTVDNKSDVTILVTPSCTGELNGFTITFDKSSTNPLEVAMGMNGTITMTVTPPASGTDTVTAENVELKFDVVQKD